MNISMAWVGRPFCMADKLSQRAPARGQYALDSQAQIMNHQRLHEKCIDAQPTRFFYSHGMAKPRAENDGDI